MWTYKICSTRHNRTILSLYMFPYSYTLLSEYVITVIRSEKLFEKEYHHIKKFNGIDSPKRTLLDLLEKETDLRPS